MPKSKVAAYLVPDRTAPVRAGLPGAFLAVPLAGALQVLLAHVLRSEDPSQSEEHHEPIDRAVHQGATQPTPGAAAAAPHLTS